MTATATPLLQVKDLHAGYGRAEVLAGLVVALLADTGFICVKLTHSTAPCARLVVDTVFGTENNAQDILWQTPPSQRMASAARYAVVIIVAALACGEHDARCHLVVACKDRCRPRSAPGWSG